MSEFAPFEAVLRQTIGLNPESVGHAMIERAVRERCAARGAPDIAAYWVLLTQSPDELQELLERVIVPETWFFRNGEAFKAVAQMALSQAPHLDRPLRLLSLPCSTGANSFRGKDLEFRNRHFMQVGERYALAETPRSKVRFRHGNLFAPTLLAGEDRYDFIFCRNVLIYFGEAEQARAVTVLGKLLDATGVLFVGPSEGGALVRANMLAAKIPLAFAFRKAAPAPTLQTITALPLIQSIGAGLDSVPLPSTSWFRRPSALPVRPLRTQVRAAARRPAEDQALAASTKAVPDDDPITAALRLADQGRMQEAAELCRRQLRERGPNAAAFYLLGLVSDAAGRHLEAREHYRKALYLEPDHTDALVHLAALLEMHGDAAGARRLNVRARRSSSTGLE